MKVWVCIVCGFVYDEEKGLPEEGIAPGPRLWRRQAGFRDEGNEDLK